MAEFKKSNSIGGGWKRKTKDNKPFISARIELAGVKHDVLLFPITEKKSEKSPDFNIILSTPKPGYVPAKPTTDVEASDGLL